MRSTPRARYFCWPWCRSSSTSAALAPQYGIIAATLGFTDLVVMGGYTVLASRVLAALHSESRTRLLNRIFGLALRRRWIIAGKFQTCRRLKLARLPTAPAIRSASPDLGQHLARHPVPDRSPVPALASLAWRFALAAALLAVLAWRAGQSLRAPPAAHAWLLVTGLVHYAGDYWSIYEAERYIPTGLVAVLFCLAVFLNALGVWLLKGQRPTRRFLLASSGAVLGVALVFWPEIATTGARTHAALGLGLGLTGVITSTIGSFFTPAPDGAKGCRC